jgi:hypothetical protein
MPENAAESPASSAPRNDGEGIFSTRERLPVYTEAAQKAAVLEGK